MDVPRGARRGALRDEKYLDLFPHQRARRFSAMKQIDSGILDRLLDPIAASLNNEAAVRLVNLRVDARTRARVGRLARKCNEGELNASEQQEYELCVLAGDLVAILQAKARLRLSRNRHPA